jgi:hypothetical protein
MKSKQNIRTTQDHKWVGQDGEDFGQHLPFVVCDVGDDVPEWAIEEFGIKAGKLPKSILPMMDEGAEPPTEEPPADDDGGFVV